MKIGMKAKAKVYAYVRVSGTTQIDGGGFDRQVQSIWEFCDKSGYEIVDTYREQISGTKAEEDRPVFAQMVSDILSNGVSTIVVESLDRLAREYRIQEQLLIYLASKDIVLIAANTGENITTAISEDPMKKALIQIQGIFAELDKSMLVKRLRKARDRKREQTGRCEGAKPHYEDGEGSEIIKRIHKARRKPRLAGKKRKPFRVIAEELNAEGYRTARGSKWTASSVAVVYKRIKN